MVEPVANLNHNLQLIGKRDALPVLNDVREIRSLKKLHNDKCYVGPGVQIVDTD
jgi:hypothetical protein